MTYKIKADPIHSHRKIVGISRLVFLLCMALGLIVSQMTQGPREEQLLKSGDVNFATRSSFNIWAVIIAIVPIALYWIFW